MIVKSYDTVSECSLLLTAHYPPKVCTKITLKKSAQKSEIFVMATETCVQGGLFKKRETPTEVAVMFIHHLRAL